jgi:hypothetical protein
MSKIALSGNASGTGTFTIASPNSNSDRTLNLPDAAGTIQVSGNPISGTTGTFTGLVDISAAGAGQIQFPATQNASSNANTLDDYEEGSWAPTITNADSYSVQVGRYVKIGKLVYINADIICTYTNTGSTNVKIGGLPFVIEDVGAMYPVGTIFPVQGFNQSTLNIATQGDVNATTITMYTFTRSTGVNFGMIVPTTFGTVVEFEFSMVYRTAG